MGYDLNCANRHYRRSRLGWRSLARLFPRIDWS